LDFQQVEERNKYEEYFNDLVVKKVMKNLTMEIQDFKSLNSAGSNLGMKNYFDVLSENYTEKEVESEGSSGCSGYYRAFRLI